MLKFTQNLYQQFEEELSHFGFRQHQAWLKFSSGKRGSVPSGESYSQEVKKTKISVLEVLWIVDFSDGDKN